MSPQLQHPSLSIREDTTRAETIPALSALLPLPTPGLQRAFSSFSSSSCYGSPPPPPPARTRASVITASVPLGCYREKLEECAALHTHVVALTCSNAVWQQELEAERSKTTRLRAIIAELQNAKRSSDHAGVRSAAAAVVVIVDARGPPPRRPSRRCSPVEEGKEERKEEREHAFPTLVSGSPPASPLSQGRTAEVGSVDNSGRSCWKPRGMPMTLVSHRLTRQLRRDVQNATQATCVEVAPLTLITSLRAASYPAVRAASPLPRARACGDDRRSPSFISSPFAAVAAAATADTLVAASRISRSNSSSCSSRDTEMSADSSVADLPRPWYSTRLSA